MNSAYYVSRAPSYDSIMNNILLHMLKSAGIAILFGVLLTVFILFIINKNDKSKKQGADGKPAVSGQDIKNILILISGSILIVLSAIVFLVTSWNTIPDVAKTFTLILLAGVFFGISSIAKNKFKLTLTSNTFYYIAILYIPIVLVSISIFKLFGEYLSCYGNGKYIYFAVSSLLLSIFYFVQVKKRGIALLLLSIIAQIAAVTSTILLFSNNFTGIVFGLLVYSLIINRLFTKDTFKIFKMKDYTALIHCIFYVIAFIAIIPMIYNITVNKCTVFDCLNAGIISLFFIVIKIGNTRLKECAEVGLIMLVTSLFSMQGARFTMYHKMLADSLLVFILNLFNYFSSKSQGLKIIYKILVYISTGFIALSLFGIFNILFYSKYIPTIVLIFTILFESVKKEVNMEYFILVLFLYSFGTLFYDLKDIVSYVATIILTLLSTYYIKKYKLNDWFLLIPALAIVPQTYFIKFAQFAEIPMHVFVSMFLITLTTYMSINKKESNKFTSLSAMYIILSILNLNLNAYLNLAIVLVWSVIHIFAFETKEDLFKAIAYIAGLVLYNKIISDIGINNITFVNLFGAFVCLFLVTRTILKKRTELYKVLEYLVTVLLYVIAFRSYTSLPDAIIFTSCTFIPIIIGYVFKLGPLFLISLMAIVINSVNLTLKFWQSIPWYVYMLVIGLALVSFAVVNEAESKKKDKQEKHIIKDAIKKLDL